MKDIISIDFKPFSWNELSESEKNTCKQSAEALEERLFLAQLFQSKTTYLVCFDNGYSFSHISALELYNFQKLKIAYNRIYERREEYTQSVLHESSTFIFGQDKIEKIKMYCKSLEPELDEILKAAQLFTMPFNREIEKIIDETTNTVVKIGGNNNL
jgi:hypothetical protein